MNFNSSTNLLVGLASATDIYPLPVGQSLMCSSSQKHPRNGRLSGCCCAGPCFFWASSHQVPTCNRSLRARLTEKTCTNNHLFMWNQMGYPQAPMWFSDPEFSMSQGILVFSETTYWRLACSCYLHTSTFSVLPFYLISYAFRFLQFFPMQRIYDSSRYYKPRAFDQGYDVVEQGYHG